MNMPRAADILNPLTAPRAAVRAPSPSRVPATIPCASVRAPFPPRRISCRPAWAACLLMAAGCTVGPDFTRPESPSPARYTAEPLRSENPPGDPAAQHVVIGGQIEADWWTLFHSDAIDLIVKEALEHNRTLAASKATLAQARELAAAKAGSLYPQVQGTAGIGRQKYGEEFLGALAKPFSFTYYAVGPTVSYTLDVSGGIARSVEESRANAEVAQHELEAAHLTVTGEAVLQSLAIASIKAQIATLNKLIAQDRDNLNLVQTALDNGSVARIDVLAAQSEIVDDLTLLPPLRQDLSKARHALSVTLGRVPASGLPPDVSLDDITLPLELPVSVPSELAHRRPDILAAEAQLHAATSAVGVAESNLYPKIQLNATAALEALRPEGLFDGSSAAWSLISGVTQPIFDGGKLRAEKRASIDLMHASAANYEQTVLEAFAQVADMLEALDHNAEELDAQTQAEQGAQGRLELTRESYAAGNSGVIQVLDAERSYQRARLGYVRATAQRYIDTVELFLALGGANPADSPARTADR
jgi:NodT family efflux transporter outer membrane factor (OMF) lipoprotein